MQAAFKLKNFNKCNIDESYQYTALQAFCLTEEGLSFIAILECLLTLDSSFASLLFFVSNQLSYALLFAGNTYIIKIMIIIVSKIAVDCALRIPTPLPALPNCKATVVIIPAIAERNAAATVGLLEKSPKSSGAVNETDINE